MMKTKWLDGLSNFIFWQVAWKLKKTSSVKNLFLTQIFFPPKKFDFCRKKISGIRFFPEKKIKDQVFQKRSKNPEIELFCFFAIEASNEKKTLILLLSWSFSSKDLKSNFFLLRYIYFMRTRLIWLLNISLIQAKSKAKWYKSS